MTESVVSPDRVCPLATMEIVWRGFNGRDVVMRRGVKNETIIGRRESFNSDSACSSPRESTVQVFAFADTEQP